VDSVNPAFEHAKQQLFRPFSFGQWNRLALVGLVAGELSSGGGCNFQVPDFSSSGHRHLSFAPPSDPLLIAVTVALLVFFVPLLWLLIVYLSSRMRFVLFDSVVAKRCEVRRFWRERREPAMRFFVWQIAFSLVTLAAIAIVIGIPALIAFAMGWLAEPRSHIGQLILFGVPVFFVLAAILVISLIVHVFTKDFVVPQMALENISAFEGWRRLWLMLKKEKGPYAGYGGMKLILAIGAAFFVGIAAIIVIVALLIPIGGLGTITVLAGKSAGLTWNVFTITAAIVAGCVFLVVVLYALSLVSVPVTVFFPAYAIYFFAARYPLLANLIYPPPPPAAIPPATGPLPEPAG
jgi:hypothetical protein